MQVSHVSSLAPNLRTNCRRAKDLSRIISLQVDKPIRDTLFSFGDALRYGGGALKEERATDLPQACHKRA